MYLQYEVSTTLDIKIRSTILLLKNVLSNSILLLEGKNGQECQDHLKNCIPCHLHTNDSIHFKLELYQLAFFILYVVRRKKLLSGFCMINANTCGIWHV